MAVIFHPPFPDFSFFFFQSDGIFFERHLRHLFDIRFIKSTFTTMFTITGITSTVITFVVSFKKGQWWQKGIYSCPLKAISDASLCILCTAFLQKLYRRNLYWKRHIWVFWWNQPYYWKRRHYNILQRFWVMLVSYNVACMLAAQVTRTELYLYVVEQA